MGLISRVSSRTYRLINNTLRMQLFIQGSALHVTEVNSEAELLEFVQKVESAPLDQLQLTLNGAPFEFSELEAEQTIHVSGKLFGGKVHGSLARAGKVKGQTPKVDKEEKK